MMLNLSNLGLTPEILPLGKDSRHQHLESLQAHLESISDQMPNLDLAMTQQTQALPVKIFNACQRIRERRPWMEMMILTRTMPAVVRYTILEAKTLST